jgi:hypothetical protein
MPTWPSDPGRIQLLQGREPDAAGCKEVSLSRYCDRSSVDAPVIPPSSISIGQDEEAAVASVMGSEAAVAAAETSVVVAFAVVPLPAAAESATTAVSPSLPPLLWVLLLLTPPSPFSFHAGSASAAQSNAAAEKGEKKGELLGLGGAVATAVSVALLFLALVTLVTLGSAVKVTSVGVRDAPVKLGLL